ncbi:MAG: arsenite methyltransferase [Dehalococcoidales bacterium]|nr:arsenite methyltransferase [Dehalococcoidales bacterium]
MKESEIKKTVREGYAQKVKTSSSCCCGQPATAKDIGKKIGYTEEELGSVPRGANLGLGCGNPLALASLKEGDTVLDLGSGAGFDTFLASGRVGEKGRVIGVDMTPEMLDQARANASEGGYRNVEFRLGEIEHLPASDSSVDVIISNCVINLSPDKGQVFGEAFRVLKPGGRLMVSDIVLLKELPDFIRQSAAAYIGCISGALMKEDYLKTIQEAGFREVRVLEESFLSIDCMANDPTAQAVINKIGATTEDIAGIEKSVASVRVSAVKPA